ncbi:MAG: HDOD domain-containing protein [Anaerolineaceae bacterium]|nr:HDOD domain-containing protein [Anaerolineaceae bacterium]
MAKNEVLNLLDRVAELNTLPEVTQRILAITEDPDASARDLNEVLKHDMALSAKLLRVVNSAFYGLPGRVSDLDRAIVLLGSTWPWRRQWLRCLPARGCRWPGSVPVGFGGTAWPRV